MGITEKNNRCKNRNNPPRPTWRHGRPASPFPVYILIHVNTLGCKGIYLPPLQLTPEVQEVTVKDCSRRRTKCCLESVDWNTEVA